MSELQTTGWQIPDRSGWTLFVGILDFGPSIEGFEPKKEPWLYLQRPDIKGVLPLAHFKSAEHAMSTITFLNAMHDTINRAILHAATQGGGEGGGESEAPAPPG